jgi:hypothetical protein
MPDAVDETTWMNDLLADVVSFDDAVERLPPEVRAAAEEARAWYRPSRADRPDSGFRDDGDRAEFGRPARARRRSRSLARSVDASSCSTWNRRRSRPARSLPRTLRRCLNTREGSPGPLFTWRTAEEICDAVGWTMLEALQEDERRERVGPFRSAKPVR